MIFKFLIVCDEVENFKREISIDADSTFLDLNNAILKSCNYSDDQITSFYVCDENWKQGSQILREEMDDSSSSDEDTFIMENTILRDIIEDINDHLVFVFDPLSERMFFIKATDMITGKNLKQPECTLSKGKAPQQILDFNESLANIDTENGNIMDDDTDFYGSDGFNEDEFDSDAYEIDE